MQSFSYQGFWWLPSQPENRIYGTVSFNLLDGVRLQTLGNEWLPIATDRRILNDDNTKTVIIHGECLVGKHRRAVTLYQCFVPSFPGHDKTITANFAFVGAYFASEAELQFSSLAFSYSHLMDWYFKTGVNSHSETDDTGKLRHHAIYDPVDELIVNCAGVSMTFRTAFEQEGTIGRVEMMDTPVVDIEFETSRSFEDFIHESRKLRFFLTLCTDISTTTTRVFGKLDRVPEQLEWPIFDVYFVESFAKVVERKNYRPLLKLVDTPSIQQHLSLWMERFDELLPVILGYGSYMFAERVPAEDRFFRLAQATEILCRILDSDSTYIDADSYGNVRESLVAAIPANTPSDLRSRLTSTLEYGNEFSFRTRLKRLLKTAFASYDLELQKVLGDTGKFVAQVVETRNYLAHGGRAPSNMPHSSRDWLLLIMRLRVLICVGLLQTIEIPEGKIQQVIQRFMGLYDQVFLTR